jgi:hypothetical protein
MSTLHSQLENLLAASCRILCSVMKPLIECLTIIDGRQTSLFYEKYDIQTSETSRQTEIIRILLQCVVYVRTDTTRLC